MKQEIIRLLDEETGERICVHLKSIDYGYGETGEAWVEVQLGVWRSDSYEILHQVR